MRYASVPDELKAQHQWVCAYDDTKKMPMQARVREAASVSDPSTWSDFETALSAVESGIYDYIGYVFADTDIIGIDIDKGFVNGQPTDLLYDITSACLSYTEVSKSGRGVHIFVRGQLPFSGRNNGQGVEIYKSGRFFITTGKVLMCPNIIDNQAGIDYVVKKYFPDVERESKEKHGSRIYSAEWMKPAEKWSLKPKYPEIRQGGRNVSLLSIGGQLRSTGYSRGEIYKELLTVNQQACKPPLSASEVEAVVKSIMRYKR